MKNLLKKANNRSAVKTAPGSMENDKLTSGKRELSFLLWQRAAMCLLLAAVTVASTVAWISMQRTTGHQTLQVQSDTADLIIESYNVYRSIWDENLMEYVCRDMTGQEFTLNGYDAVFGKDRKTAAFVRVKLIGDALTPGKRVMFTLTRQNTSPEPGGVATTGNGMMKSGTQQMADYLSNIVEVSAAQINALVGETNPTTIYTTAAAYGGWTAADTFATSQKVNGKTMPSTKAAQTPGVTCTVTSAGSVELFLKLDYNKDLVMAYINSNTGNNQAHRLDKMLSYDFTGDLIEVTIQVLDPA